MNYNSGKLLEPPQPIENRKKKNGVPDPDLHDFVGSASALKAHGSVPDPTFIGPIAKKLIINIIIFVCPIYLNYKKSVRYVILYFQFKTEKI
jgi:hypothetical protein